MMKKIIRIVVIFSFMFFCEIGSTAAMFCSSPTMFSTQPSSPILIKPSPPFCLSSFSDTKCDRWEVDSYLSDVEQYIQRLQDFANEAIEFANAAIEFSNDAQAYAKCEAKDVVNQTR